MGGNFFCCTIDLFAITIYSTFVWIVEIYIIVNHETFARIINTESNQLTSIHVLVELFVKLL
jgi:hypothetical protein